MRARAETFFLHDTSFCNQEITKELKQNQGKKKEERILSTQFPLSLAPL